MFCSVIALTGFESVLFPKDNNFTSSEYVGRHRIMDFIFRVTDKSIDYSGVAVVLVMQSPKHSIKNCPSNTTETIKKYVADEDIISEDKEDSSECTLSDSEYVCSFLIQ